MLREAFMNPQEHPWFSLPPAGAMRLNGINNPDQDEAVQQLNLLLRGEIAASETYRMAIDKLIKDGQDPSRVATLSEIQREHIRAEQIFRKRISELGGVPEDSSGIGGAWARVAMGTAQLFGDSAALHALREGEEQGLREMQAGLASVDAESAMLLEKVMIRAQARHVKRITSLIGLISA
jgi:hypothetical protein